MSRKRIRAHCGAATGQKRPARLKLDYVVHENVGELSAEMLVDLYVLSCGVLSDLWSSWRSC